MRVENRVEDLDKNETGPVGRCFKALFWIPSGPGALLNLRNVMVSCTSSGLVNFGFLAGFRT